MRWKIEGFDGDRSLGLDREETATETVITSLLERLVARDLTMDEIIDATVGSGTHFQVNKDKRLGQHVQLTTTGTPHYIAIAVKNAHRT